MINHPIILRVKKVAYFFISVVALMPFLAYQLGNLWEQEWIQAWTVLLFLFVVIPIVDWMVGTDEYNPNIQEDRSLQQSSYYRWVACLVVPLQLFNVFWGVAVFSSGYLSMANSIGWILSCGVISSTIGITLAHELIHKNSKFEPLLGGIVMSSVCYGTFKVEHVRGHHVNVSTPKDNSSARKGENIYLFVIKAIIGNFSNAWALEIKKLQRKQKSWFSLSNELIGWTSLSVSFGAVAYWFGGWSGVFFFMMQSLVAILLLEVINYVEHYGLSRKELKNGQYERVSRLHSWNSSFLVSNVLLFQLQRHSDHHETPRRRYQQLRSYTDSPQLPAGYATMFLLALFPWAWKKVMDPIVDEHMRQQEKIREERLVRTEAAA